MLDIAAFNRKKKQNIYTSSISACLYTIRIKFLLIIEILLFFIYLDSNNTDENIAPNPNNRHQSESESNKEIPSNTSQPNDHVEKQALNLSKYQFIKTNMIVYYGRQLFCLFIVILTVYATYQNM